MKLRTKLAIALIFVAVVLSAGVYGGLEAYKDRLVGEAQMEVNETAALTADQIDTAVEQRKDFIGFAASRPQAARFNESDSYLRELVGNTRFFAAQIVAANGTIVDFNGDVTRDVREEAIGTNVSDRDYVQVALDGDVYMTSPEYAPAPGEYITIVSAPIFEGREIKGVLAAAIYVDRQTFFTTLGPLETSGQSVSVHDGSVSLFEHHQMYEQEITATATVESTGWTVTIVRDRSGLIAQLRDLATAQAVGLFLVLLSVVAFGVWEYRTTLNQTERLLAGFAALQRGEFDRRLRLTAGEEWEHISNGFNELAAYLADRETELRRREQRLEVLNRVLRHNLRNDTSIILGYAELIRDSADNSQLRAAADTILDTAWELTEFSNKARQVDAALQGYRDGPQPIDVAMLVRRVLDGLRTRYPDVEISASLPSEAWASTVPVFELAVENLCENACEHNTAPKPRLNVTVTEVGGIVRIELTDNGPGIPESEQVALHKGRETPLEHTSGLGLWLATWTIERSEGDLWFDDNDPRGTVVIVELPRAHPDLEPADEPSRNPTEVG